MNFIIIQNGVYTGHHADLVQAIKAAKRVPYGTATQILSADLHAPTHGCDGCNAITYLDGPQNGWYVNDEVAYCPECRKDAHL